MATQIVMDHTGHSRHEFDAGDAEALAKAERRFRALIGEGFTAAVRTAEGESCRVFAFDPTASETLFFRRLRGG
ncbi:hypothetical protein SAMN05216338_101862 [Bradyrhizobium sp. Rc2d]|uniref:hypothetical protein n=1 Tax=Bradyrhizobium sp. Rc2d TaxID=1855321 RepID=UPI000881474D|nr:hypothetical protein [Bradyrhizobium sp. Rc2d]SDI17638.1 hypothetical protein SAMN05216338_101862 [Bradyrhizobium sp. Rc2d]